MGMTIDDHIEVLKSYHHGFTGCAGNLQDSIDVVVDIMQKYQKIEKIVKEMKYSKSDIVGLYRHNTEYYMGMIERVLEDGRN